MSIVSRRTVGQILLAYDDGTSPPTETTPLGSIVSVADGTLWVSLGGSYTQASGGGPLGDSTVWSSRIDWADLGTLPSGDIRSGDLAPISNLGGVSTSYGTAIYNGGWALFSGYFQDPADLLAFTQPINTGAVVSVGAANENGIRYYYDSVQWDRTPDGIHYVWGQVADWAALSTIIAPKNNDEVHVQTLGTTHSSGTAQLHSGTWKLVEGRWTSVSDMNDWAEGGIHPGAIAFIDPTHHYDEDSTVYYRSESNWVRMANNVPFTWDITDLTNIDPSGIGATQIGDFGRYTNPTTSAVEVYRLRSVPAVGSINLTVWVPASIYGEAGLTIRGYLIGTETMPASGGNIQGYLVNANGASASVTTSGGEVVITSTTISHFALIQSTYALQPSDQYYVRMNIRLSQTAATAMTFYNLLYDGGTTQPQFISTQNPNIELGKYIPSTTTPTLVGSTLMIRGGGTAIVNTAEVLEVLADGTAANLVNVTRNARPYFSMRRNAQTGTATGQHLIQTFQNATGAQTARLSYLYFMTY